MSDNCTWTQESDYDSEIWVTDCSHAFCLYDGTPSENGFNFCCYCGKPLVEETFVDEVDDADE